ncbi:MAG: Na(+)/H(+) antiporter subunit C1 [candidate division WS2 bacterium]|nr:Na(+)/H(+) antiporter subunit C1 [Candidatus Lithacetigena glycinireducens]
MIYLLTLVLFCTGLYAVLVKKNLIKIIIGISIMEYAINLFFVLIGYKHGGVFPIISKSDIISKPYTLNPELTMVDPLPQALILTAIVIGLATTALLAAIAVRLYEKTGTFDITKMRKLHG